MSLAMRCPTTTPPCMLELRFRVGLNSCAIPTTPGTLALSLICHPPRTSPFRASCSLPTTSISDINFSLPIVYDGLQGLSVKYDQDIKNEIPFRLIMEYKIMAVDPHLVRVSDNIDPTDSEGETELGLLGSGSKSMYKVEGGDGDGESRDGSTYKVETQSGNFLIYKYVMPSSQYSEFGLANIHELDLATRLQHPAIMHAIKVVISSDRVGYLLPLAERSLVDLIQDQFVTTDVKLPILYKIATGLAFLHQNNILHLNVNPEHIVLQGFGEGKYQPLLLLDDRGRPNSINYQAPEGGMSEKVDVWAFGMVMLQLINP